MTTLAILFILVWAAVTVYFLRMSMGQRKVEQQLQSVIESVTDAVNRDD